MKSKNRWYLGGCNRYGDFPVYRAEVQLMEFSEKEVNDFLEQNNLITKKLNLSRKINVSAWELLIKSIAHLCNVPIFFYKEHSSTNKNYVYIVFSVNSEELGKAILGEVLSLVKFKKLKIESASIDKLYSIKEEHCQKPITKRFIAEAKKRNIPHFILNKDPSVLQLGYGSKMQKTWSALTSKTTRIGAKLTADKYMLNKLLKKIDIPVPDSQLIKDLEELKSIFKKFPLPVVIKPANATIGRGVTLNINTFSEARKAYDFARKISKKVIIEDQISGHYYRLTFIDKKMIACAKALPVYIYGNGKDSLEKLIQKENRKKYRQDQDKNKAFYKIEISEKIKNIISFQGYSLSFIIPKNKKVFLSFSGADGGEWIEDNASVHPENIKIMQRALTFADLNIAGIDVISLDISKSFNGNNGKILEINAGPDINIHANVNRGKKIIIEKFILNSLFSKKETGRIPIISITGTNGKTTTSKLIAHILDNPKKRTLGLTTSANKYINKDIARKGDMSGFLSARSLLMNPQIDVAVLETCHILGVDRFGLGYDWSDASIITNLTEDHLGTFCTKTMQDLFEIKSVVARRTKKDGYLILNADNSFTVKMSKFTQATVAYFSLDHKNKYIKSNIKNNQPAYYLKDNCLCEHNNGKKEKIAEVSDIPIAFGGRADFNIYNALAVIASIRLVFRDEVSLEELKEKLSSFGLDSEFNPGRFNVIDKNKFRVIVDYAHNPDGYKKAIELAKKMKHNRLIGVIKVAGDRSDKLIKDVGRLAGENFDYIFIKAPSEEKLRGSSKKEICDKLKQSVLATEFPESNIKIIYKEGRAVQKALSTSKKGDLVLIFAHNVSDVLKIVKEYEK